MNSQVIRAGQPFQLHDTGCDLAYLEESRLCLRRYATSWQITLLDNAMQAGKFCYSFRLMANSGAQLWNGIRHCVPGVTPAKLRAFLLAERKRLELPDTDSYHREIYLYGLSIAFEQRPGRRVFSPFELWRLRPLDALPTRFTLVHVRRALANGQYHGLRCTGRYTDDYAADAAGNCQQGTLAALPLLLRLIEDPSGWWTHLDEATLRVSVCCHHFDNNAFTLVV